METVHAEDPAIVLSEGECDQTCPVYDMTLKPDGSYLLNGVRFVKTPGSQRWRAGRRAAWDAAEKGACRIANFWLLEPDPDLQLPDHVPAGYADRRDHLAERGRKSRKP